MTTKTSTRKVAKKRTTATPKTTASQNVDKPKVTKAKTSKATKSKAKAKAPASEKRTVTNGVANRPINAMGFVPGSDSSVVARHLVDGGASRGDIADRIREELVANGSGLTTRNGQQKNIPALVSGMVTRLVAEGYTVKSEYSLVPPADKKAAIAAEKRKEARRKKK